MITILVKHQTERLTYTLNWIFQERLGLQYRCVPTHTTTLSPDDNQPIINYTDNKQFPGLWIKPSAILFQTNIEEPAVHYHRWKHTAILFYNKPGAAIPFDLFGAIFFLLSRYEEYLPHKKDKHKRFPSSASVAAKFHFLQEPVVDIWIMELAKILFKTFGISSTQHQFRLQTSFDIDIAYNYQYKPTWKNILGGIKDILKGKLSLVKLRIAVVNGREPDPYDNFEWLATLHQQYELKPLFFWLLAERNSALDTNNPPQSDYMQQLLRRYKGTVTYGIHPSFYSDVEPELLTQEINTLNKITPIDSSRYHYIKLNLPATYHQLIEHGITNDYSMGYPDANGFRAGTSNSFPWFDLRNNTVTDLRIHPFVFMDATSIFYSKHKPEKAFAELERIYWAIHKTNSRMIVIFHNYTLGKKGTYFGWRKNYESLLELTQKTTPPLL